MSIKNLSYFMRMKLNMEILEYFFRIAKLKKHISIFFQVDLFKNIQINLDRFSSKVFMLLKHEQILNKRIMQVRKFVCKKILPKILLQRQERL